MTYKRPWEFIVGRVSLILWTLSAIVFAVLAVILVSANNPTWVLEVLLAVWAISNIVKYALELRYNIARRKEAVK